MRFLRFTIIVWLTVAVLICVAELYGYFRSKPNQLNVLGFDLCGNRLCFLGIMPGLTTWDDAVGNLDKYGVNLTTAETVYLIGHTEIIIGYDSRSQIVQGLLIRGEQNAPLPLEAGDVVRYLGSPCGFNPDTFDSEVILIYPHEYVSLSIDYRGLSPTTSINSIQLPSVNLDCNDGAPWPGFTTSERYWSLYQNSSK